ncbi:hypothetical protein MMC13_000674 [Lambiella insularis]|nr:hypothetical protein [Lambiella insularis]
MQQRLPIGWPYIVNYNLGGTLDPTYSGYYDSLVQACLATGAHCILDLHAYARWYNGTVGQSGVTNADLTSVWTQLAAKYASQPDIIFGTMNEPHDLDMDTWAATVQEVVLAIRQAGATNQLILLPGTDFTAAGGFSINSAPALSTVVDTDGTTSKLIYDIHQYLDSDFTGTHPDCVTDGTANLATLATYLRANSRQAFLTETGGGNNQNCVNYMRNQLGFLNINSDVFLGWQGWAAGAFDPTSYALSEVPVGDTDTLLVQQCIAGLF